MKLNDLKNTQLAVIGGLAILVACATTAKADGAPAGWYLSADSGINILESFRGISTEPGLRGDVAGGLRTQPLAPVDLGRGDGNREPLQQHQIPQTRRRRHSDSASRQSGAELSPRQVGSLLGGSARAATIRPFRPAETSTIPTRTSLSRRRPGCVTKCAITSRWGWATNTWPILPPGTSPSATMRSFSPRRITSDPRRASRPFLHWRRVPPAPVGTAAAPVPD